MNKIKDRFIVGAVAGLGGNIAKDLVEYGLGRAGVLKVNSTRRAAGMMFRTRHPRSLRARIGGHLADTAVSSMLGIATTYALSLTGGDHALAKGAIMGGMMWAGLNGGLATLGVTRVRNTAPTSALGNLASQVTYGVVTAAIASRIGDPGLFNGKTPLLASELPV
ncbi:MAG: hypothetical protein ACM3XN_06720 [Chloroflexota bacterium]